MLCGHFAKLPYCVDICKNYHTVCTFAKCLVLCKTNVYLIYFYLRAVEVFSSLKFVLIKKSSRNINAHKNNIVDSLFYFIINNCTKLFSCKRPSVFEPLLFGKIISLKKVLNETLWRTTDFLAWLVGLALDSYFQRVGVRSFAWTKKATIIWIMAATWRCFCYKNSHRKTWLISKICWG